MPVFSDDLPLRMVAETELSISGFCTQPVLMELRGDGIISSDEYYAAVEWLIRKKYHFTSVDKDGICWVLANRSWSPDERAASILAALSGSECDEDDAVAIGIEILRSIHGSISPQTTKQLLGDLVITSIVAGIAPRTVLTKLAQRNAVVNRIWTPTVAAIQNALQVWAKAKSDGF